MVKKIKEKKGTVILETLIMFGFLLALLSVLITGGQMIMNKVALNFAVQSGLREACSEAKNISQAKTIATTRIKEILKDNGIKIKLSDIKINCNSSFKNGSFLTIEVKGIYDTLFPVPNIDNTHFSSKKSTMYSSLTMMIIGTEKTIAKEK